MIEWREAEGSVAAVVLLPAGEASPRAKPREMVALRFMRRPYPYAGRGGYRFLYESGCINRATIVGARFSITYGRPLARPVTSVRNSDGVTQRSRPAWGAL